MPACGVLKLLPVLIAFWVLVSSCAEVPPKPPGANFYVTPEIAYLRDRGSYEGNVLGQLYQGDQVERLGDFKSPWWQVRDVRSGQTGWIQKELLSPEPVASTYYYVNQDSLALRDCPQPTCASLQVLFRGDRVQKVAENDQGWWRILVPETRTLGWARAAALTEQVAETRSQGPQKSYLYVAVKKLNLRAKPDEQSELVKILGFNDQVQKLEETTTGWAKVRQPSSGALGWVKTSLLGNLPAAFPRDRGRGERAPEPLKPRETPSVEPEFM
jgi:uncharacterized protein YgiM (DUF1202 family)